MRGVPDRGPGTVRCQLGAAALFAAVALAVVAGMAALVRAAAATAGAPAFCSRARKVLSSAMVVITGAGNTTVVFCQAGENPGDDVHVRLLS